MPKVLTACPICASSSIAPHYTGRAVRAEWQDGKTFDVHRCNDCGHGFMNTTYDFEELQDYYSSGYPAYGVDHDTARFDRAVAEARRTGRHRHTEIRPGMRVLDVGCGGGAFLRVAQALGAEVQGVEPSAHGAAAAASIGLPVFHGMLADFADTAPAPFDLVTCNHVLEHEQEPLRLLARMGALLKPGGTLYVAVPNAGSFLARGSGWMWHSADLPVHLQQFSTGSLARTLRSAGFEDIALSTASARTLANSGGTWLRRQLGVPRRLSAPVLRPLLEGDTPLARAVDRLGGGDAIIALSRSRL